MYIYFVISLSAILYSKNYKFHDYSRMHIIQSCSISILFENIFCIIHFLHIPSIIPTNYEATTIIFINSIIIQVYIVRLVDF